MNAPKNYQHIFRFLTLSPPWDRYLPVLLTVCAGALFSITVFFAVRWWEYQDIAKEFQLAAEDRALAVKGTFNTESGMLELVRTAMETANQVERKQFKRFVAPFRSRSRSIEAVEWAPRVEGSERSEFVAAARREGLVDYQITEMDPDGKMAPAQRRRVYYPIYYVGPRPGNPTVYGFDVASEPVRREALFMAGDTGDTVASGRIDFVQDEKQTAGFLLVLPVYEQGKPIVSIGDRRENLRGFILGVFRPDDMITAALAKLHPEGIDVCLYDPSVPEDGRPFPFHASRTRKTPWEPTNAKELKQANRLHYIAPLQVKGSQWTVVCLAAPDFIAARRTLWPWAVLAAGLALTGILAAYVSSSIERKMYVDQLLVEKRLHADQLQDKVRRQTADIRRAQEEVTYRLLSAAECRDEETGAHVRRVGLMSEALARAAGWSNDDVDCMRQAAPMHDLGKIGIPDAILRKPGKLTRKEFEIMKSHTTLGAKMLADSNTPMLQMAERIALGHHERWDGNGYPNGLAGQDIPEAARIVSIVDVYDALTHARVYKPAMPEDEALSIIKSEVGRQFDPLLLAQFFLHLPELREIAEAHPDEELDLVDTTCVADLSTSDTYAEAPSA